MNPTQEIPTLSSLCEVNGSLPGSRTRICIVSPEFIGPSKNGGIGTAYTALAEALAEAGHDVTCLYSHANECPPDTLETWVAAFRRKRIKLIGLPPLSISIDAMPYSTKSFQVYSWLKGAESFDVVHFPDWQALGYHTAVAKKQGLFFQKTTLCVGLHSMTEWLKFANRQYITTVTDLELDFVERQAVALADVVISPSRYLLRWIMDRGWNVPEKCYVQQNIMPKSASTTRVPAEHDGGIRELVFFGRLETRKGVQLFCDAVDLLSSEVRSRVNVVTFLGKTAMVEGTPGDVFVKLRGERWNWQVEVKTDLNQPEAMKFLAESGRLAVIPSLIENSPYTVLECLGAGIAFIATAVGGIPELISPEDIGRVCFEPTTAALAEKLTQVLMQGYVRAVPALSPSDNQSAWVQWHATQIGGGSSGVSAPKSDCSKKVSLCISTYNRPRLLMQALESVRAIKYPNLEVVLVDDGSTDPEAVKFLKELEPEFGERKWQIVRQANKYLGAARNTAARHSTGDFLLFMDDDNYAEAHEVCTLVAVAEKTGADIVSCGMNYFSGEERPNRAVPPRGRWLPVGPSPALGAFCNTFGDANALVRRSCFEAVGGFTEDYGVTHEDWEFHAKAVLKGFRLEVVPEFLFWYRVNANSMIRTLPKYPNYMRSIRPYIDAVPAGLRNLVLFAQGEHLRQLQLGMEITPYAQFTIKWKAKLEAGLALMELKQDAAAAKMMIAGINAVEKCPVPQVLVEALIEIPSHLAKLDLPRAQFLVGLAIKYSEAFGWKDQEERARKLQGSFPRSSSRATITAPGKRSEPVTVA